ncbi:hypothetical protein [Xanthomonas oryzae]|nr:hypothetical protein [Xanthomonas oryzae]QBI15673.1 hypothetical protein EYR03_08490 [Xanthomonas oryzae pv. oryzae]TAO91389.1 hypothetical protein EYR05_08490 [Xanthomonas oryzae pv. oryzae]TAP15009.1 hypothetical protein EYR01_23790 [Xanthomonas oryzae pv. oryzae]UWI58135.1 hypothetical protein NO430_08125 [Xanthomonas oryzae pv. oryzae]
MSTSHVCKRPAIANMDHTVGSSRDRSQMVNRMCLTCCTHWYGDADQAVFEMPQRVWDRWMNKALEITA